MKIGNNGSNLFSAIDTNNDGKITKDELQAFRTQQPDGRTATDGGPTIDEIFSRIDTNGDGSIDKREADAFAQTQQTQKAHHGHHHHRAKDPAAMAKTLFDKADVNGDGQVTQAELTAALPASTPASMVDQLFKDADTNGDGSISQSDLQASLEKQLQHVRGYDQSGQATAGSAAPAARSIAIA